MDQYQDCAVSLPKFVSKFNPDSKRMIFIVENEAECQHAYTLFPASNNVNYLHWLINNVTTIKKSIECYKVCAKDIIYEAQQPENRFTLPFFSNDPNTIGNLVSVEKGQSIFNNKTSDPLIIHRKTGKLLNLAPQQTRCLAALLEGKACKEIALDLGLSCRSVEHYIQRIRKILGLKNSKELLAEYTLFNERPT